MSTPNSAGTGSSPPDNPTSPDQSARSQITSLTEDELRRWAELIATGATSFPEQLPLDLQDRLLDLVCKQRGFRLRNLVVRAIARDLWERAPVT